MTKVVLPLKVLWCGKCFPSLCFPDMTLLIDPSVSTDTRSPWLCMAALPLNYFPLLPIQISESELIWEQQPEEEKTCQSSVVGLKTFLPAVRISSGWLGRNQTCRLQDPVRSGGRFFSFTLYTKRELQCQNVMWLLPWLVNVLENHLEWEHSVFLPVATYIAADYSSADQTSSEYTTIITTRYLHFSGVQFLVMNFIIQLRSFNIY